MRVLLVNRNTASGNDIFFGNLKRALEKYTTVTCLELPLSACVFLAGKDARALRSTLETFAPDIAIANIEQLYRLRWMNIPIIGIAHHDPAGTEFVQHLTLLKRCYYLLVMKRRFRNGLEQSNMVVAVSHYTKRAIEKLELNIPSNKVKVIHNGIDVDYFTPGSTSRKQGDPIRLLFVGNPSVRKGFDLLPGIMSELGLPYQLEYTAGLRSCKAAAVYPENMKSIGKLTREQLRTAYRTSDMLLFPSRLEGFGYAAVEALACGLPVVGVSASTLPEILPDSLQAFQAREHEEKEIAEKVRECASSVIQPLALHDYVRSRFSLERLAAAYHELLEEMLGR